MVQFCFSLLPLTLVKASELCKEPVRFFRYIICCLVSRLCQTLRLRKLRCIQKLRRQVFSSYTDTPTTKTVQFFFLAEFITPEMEVHVSFFYQKNTATCTAVQSRQFLPVSKTGYTFNLTCHSTISPLFQVNFEIFPILL